MSLDKKAALEQIDSALKRYHKYREMSQQYANEAPGVLAGHQSEIDFRLKAVLDRLGPEGTVYRRSPHSSTEHLVGQLQALRAEIESGYLQTFKELIHGETFSDFLDMASHLLGEGYHVAAATVAGGVLEQHLRTLCTKHSITPIPENLNKLNAALYKQPPGAFGSDWMKQITAWADIRNNASHGHYDKVNAGLVETMIAGIRLFTAGYPA